MDEQKEKGIKINLIAIIIAFAFGLTLGQIDFKEMLEPGSNYKSRELTSAVSAESTTGGTQAYAVSPTAVQSMSALINKTSEISELVYRTPTGQRYHYNPDCAGANRIESSIDESTALGLTPCKKCADG